MADRLSMDGELPMQATHPSDRDSSALAWREFELGDRSVSVPLPLLLRKLARPWPRPAGLQLTATRGDSGWYRQRRHQVLDKNISAHD